MATQKGLGKGLGALFGDINEQTETPAEGAVSLPLQKIEPNPLQPRKTFDPDELDVSFNGVMVCRGGQIGCSFHADLAFAVVAHAGRLEDAGQEISRDGR